MFKFLAANDKLMFWVETLSLVDLLTIPQVFVSVVLQQNWLGKIYLVIFSCIWWEQIYANKKTDAYTPINLGLCDRHLFDRYLYDRHPFDRHLYDRHLFDRHLFDRHLYDRHLYDRHVNDKHLKTGRQYNGKAYERSW